jgi:hypothetical protein
VGRVSEQKPAPMGNSDDVRWPRARMSLGCAPTVYRRRPKRLPRGQTDGRAKMAGGGRFSLLPWYLFRDLLAVWIEARAAGSSWLYWQAVMRSQLARWSLVLARTSEGRLRRCAREEEQSHLTCGPGASINRGHARAVND